MIEWGDDRLPASFWRYVHPCPNTGCWLWGGPTTPKGYGMARVAGRRRTASRHMLDAAMPGHGGDVARHRCDVRWCVNPACLLPGTQAENLADMVARGRDRPWNRLSAPPQCPTHDREKAVARRSGRKAARQFYCPACRADRRAARTPDQIEHERRQNASARRRRRGVA